MRGQASIPLPFQCLDWLDDIDSVTVDRDRDRAPICLFLPGLTGDSQSEYIKSFVNVANRQIGARCVVFNFRGRGGHAITTPRTYCASKYDDLNHVLEHIRLLYPSAPVMAVGISLGGIVLGNYLAGEGEAARKLVDASLLISVCFDTFRGTESIEQKGLNILLNRHLANCLVASIKEVSEVPSVPSQIRT